MAEGLNKRQQAEFRGMPVRVFLFTLDQISMMIDVDEKTLKRSYIYFDGRSTGNRPRGHMLARNIAQDKDKPDWRVAETEFIRWLRYKGFRIYDRAFVTK